MVGFDEQWPISRSTNLSLMKTRGTRRVAPAKLHSLGYPSACIDHDRSEIDTES